MNVNINDKQQNNDRTTKEQQAMTAFDENKFPTNRRTVAFDEIFRWRKFFCYTVLKQRVW